MAAINNGIVTSFGNTPQAVDDVFNTAALGVGPSGAYVPILIDVMANDKAGGAKTLYSLMTARAPGHPPDRSANARSGPHRGYQYRYER